TMIAILSSKPSKRRDGGVESKTGKPSTQHKPSQAGTIATCAVAAKPIISRLPTSSAVAKPAAIPTTQEIKTPVPAELNSEYRTGGSLKSPTTTPPIIKRTVATDIESIPCTVSRHCRVQRPKP